MWSLGWKNKNYFPQGTERLHPTLSTSEVRQLTPPKPCKGPEAQRTPTYLFPSFLKKYMVAMQGWGKRDMKMREQWDGRGNFR